MITPDRVDYHYEWGEDGYAACRRYDCADALRRALSQQAVDERWAPGALSAEALRQRCGLPA